MNEGRTVREGARIELVPVNESNFRAVVDMKLPEEQRRFVAPNVVSLAQAWLEYDVARPYAVCCDGRPVGFLMFDWDVGERNAGIWRFMIAHSEQGRGYGRAALEAAIALVRERGEFDMMNLDYVPGNDTAAALYRSLGFRETGEICEGELCMTLPLTDSPRIGSLTADDEDMEDFVALIDRALQCGASVPEIFLDREALSEAVSAGRVTRITLMAETVGLALGGELIVDKAHTGRLAEIEARLKQS